MKMLTRLVGTVVFGMAISCGGGGGGNNESTPAQIPDQTPGEASVGVHVLYALDQRNENIVVYRPGENGTLGEPHPHAITGGTPAGFAINPEEQYMYIMYIGFFSAGGYAPNNLVTRYSLGTTGDLMESMRFSLGSGRGPGATAFTTDGKFVYVADPNAYKMYGFAVQSDGTWSIINGVSTPSMPIDIAVHPGNKFLYAANMGADALKLYRIEASGALALVGTTGQVSNQMDIEFVAQGRYAYVTTKGGDIIITEVDVNTGTFSSPQRLVIEKDGLGGMMIDETEEFAYTLNCPLKQITAYRIQSNADLTRVGKIILGDCPITLALDKERNTAYLGTLNRSEITVLDIGKDGSLASREVVPLRYVPRQLLIVKK